MYTIAIIGYGGMGGYHAKQLLSLPEEFRLAGPAATLSRERIAGMSREEFDRTVRGTPIRRAGYDGLRRNVSEISS